MLASYVFILCLVSSVICDQCYWNRECPYMLYSSKTPYDTVRGDIRDYSKLENCDAVSLWSLNRHGNRNPGSSVTAAMKLITELKDDIIASYEAGTSELCAQDIQELIRYQWNATLEVSQSFLTATGYEELYDLAQRLRVTFPHLLDSRDGKTYFRATNEQRTVVSAMAFVHGLSDETDLEFPVDGPFERDDLIRPYSTCDRYQELVKDSAILQQNLQDYVESAEYIAVQRSVQRRLGIAHQLSVDDIYAIYELCRFERCWTTTLHSPWCSVLTDEDLVVLEYRDDVRHYHRNGHGSWVNENLGRMTVKDLYETFEAVVKGEGRSWVTYFSHDAMLQMVFTAMGLFKDDQPITGSSIDPNRVWRTSDIAAFSTNILAVLNRCNESSTITHRVQVFVNEKETTLCPLSGCTWEQFQEKFQDFTDSNLDFCSLDYIVPDSTNKAYAVKGVFGIAALLQILHLRINF